MKATDRGEWVKVADVRKAMVPTGGTIEQAAQRLVTAIETYEDADTRWRMAKSPSSEEDTAIADIERAAFEQRSAYDDLRSLLREHHVPNQGTTEDPIEAAAKIVDEFHDIQFSAHYPDGREKMRFTSFDVGREIRSLTKALSERIRALRHVPDRGPITAPTDATPGAAP